MSISDISNVFGFLGGLGMFLYGMNIMADGMQKTAGSRMSSFLGMLTNNRLLAVALGAVMALNKTNLHCPEDISLMGFDDLIMSHVIHPRLHMVVQPMKEMGEKAAELLLERIGSGQQEMAMEIVLGTRISEGDSVAEIG